MKRKKLLSTVVAGALVATQMVMPVMAADGGEMDVEVTTKTAVIRVEVPTTMAIAVDQFMMTGDNTQISSDAFEMTNKSAIDVKVTVTSTAKLAATTKLVATKAGAADSTKAGEAWLGVAAQSGSGDYDDPTTDTSSGEGDDAVADTPETIGTLTEVNKNVVTFVQGTGEDAAKGKASQVFYLAKGDGAVAYKLLNAGEDASAINYAQFYKLEAKSVDSDGLATLLKDGDVYVAAAAAADGQSLTLVEKGGSHTFSGSEVYYTAAATPTAKASLDAGELYVYGSTANAASTGGVAAFRYFGTLSGAQESWTSTDIEKITIKYDIVGVTAEKYAEVEDDVTYGLYIPADAAPSIKVTTYKLTADTPVEIEVSLGGGTLGATTISKVTDASGNAVEKGAQWDYANGKLTFTAARANALLSAKASKVYVIHFDDEAKTKINVTLNGAN